jgi:hypothetical protein
MGKATRSLSGASQKKYVRDLVGSIDGITPEAAAALTSACEREIAQVRVRLPIPERGKPAKSSKKNAATEPARVDSSAAAAGPATAAATAEFDPFAFSVVVVVTKEGREGLANKLATIGPADLKALAKAQHVALPEGELSTEDLRAAIVGGALQRIANRKAAAS